MDLVWDEEKNNWLKARRGISFEEIAGLISEGEFIEIVENPAREDQEYFILTIRDYTWLVPFVVSDEEAIVLKTAFPSRKFHKLYGGAK